MLVLLGNVSGTGTLMQMPYRRWQPVPQASAPLPQRPSAPQHSPSGQHASSLAGPQVPRDLANDLQLEGFGLAASHVPYFS